MKAVYTILGQIVKYIPPRFNLHSCHLVLFNETWRHFRLRSFSAFSLFYAPNGQNENFSFSPSFGAIFHTFSPFC